MVLIRRCRRGVSFPEVALASLLVTILVAPLLYFFTTAQRQATRLEDTFLAHSRTRFEVARAVRRGLADGFVTGVTPIHLESDEGARLDGELSIAAVPGHPGLFRVTGRMDLPGRGPVVHERLGLDGSTYLTGGGAPLP